MAAEKYVLFIPDLGEVERRNTKPTMDEVHSFLGGYFERVRLRDPETKRACTLYVNENGYAHRLPINERATKLYRANFGPGHAIVGNAILFFGWSTPA